MSRHDEASISYYRNALTNFYENNDYLRAILISEKIIDYYKNAAKDESFAEDIYNIACIYMDVSKFKEAGELLEDIISNIDIKRISDRILINILNSMAVCYARNSKPIAAEEYFEKAMKMFGNNKKFNGNPYVLSYNVLVHNMGSVKLDLGKFDEAVVLLSEELKYSEKKTIEYSDTLILLAAAFEGKKDYGESINYIKEAINVIKKISGINSKEYMEMVYYLAGIYYKNKDYNNAFIYYDKTGELVKKFLSENHPFFAEVLNKISNIYLCLNNIDRAIFLRHKAMGIIKNTFGDLHVYYIYCLEKLAVTYKQKGDYKSAVQAIKKVIEIKEKINGKKTESYIKSLLLMFNFYLDSDDFESALDVLKEASLLSRKFPNLSRDIKFYKIDAYIAQGNVKKAVTLIKQFCRNQDLEYEHFIEYIEKSKYSAQEDLTFIYNAFGVDEKNRKIKKQREYDDAVNEIVGMFDGKSTSIMNRTDKILGSVIDIVAAARKSNIENNKIDDFIGGLERLANSIMEDDPEEISDFINEYGETGEFEDYFDDDDDYTDDDSDDEDDDILF